MPCSLKFFFSEIQPHWFWNTWESLHSFPMGILQFLNPSILLSPYCGQKQSLVPIIPLLGTSAMRHLSHACDCWFLHDLTLSIVYIYISISQYMRTKLFSYWFMLCHWLMSKYFWCLTIMTKINHSICMPRPFNLKKKENYNARFLSHKITNSFKGRSVRNVQNINKLCLPVFTVSEVTKFWGVY